MFPAIRIEYALDDLPADAIVSRYLLRRFCSTQQENRSRLGIADPCVVALLTPENSTADETIASVVRVSAKFRVIDAETKPIVAAMTYDKPIRNRPMRDLPHGARERYWPFVKRGRGVALMLRKREALVAPAGCNSVTNRHEGESSPPAPAQFVEPIERNQVASHQAKTPFNSRSRCSALKRSANSRRRGSAFSRRPVPEQQLQARGSLPEAY